MQDFGFGEEVALEVVVAEIARLFELFAAFDLLRQELDATREIDLGHAAALGGGADHPVDLDDVGEIDQGGEAGGIDEVVEGDGEARFFDRLHRGDELFVGLDGFENFGHHPVGWEDQEIAAAQDIGAEVDEGQLATDEGVEFENHAAVDDHLPRRLVGIGAAVGVGPAAAKEQLVGKEIDFAIEDGLARDEGVHERAPDWLEGRAGACYGTI